MAEGATIRGEMERRIRAHDWAATPLGPMASWPRSLLFAVNLMLDSRQPVYIAWGRELTSLYNDACLPLLGVKHPRALGQPLGEVWREIWDSHRHAVEAVLAGEALQRNDQPVVLEGRREHSGPSWFSFSWTPLRDDDGRIAGLLSIATETTDRVLGEQSLLEALDECFSEVELIRDAEGRATDARHVRVNTAFQTHSGLGSVVGRTIRELTPAIEDIWFETFQNVAESGEAVRFVAESPSLKRWFDSYVFRTRQHPARVAVLFRDISEQKRAEQAQREVQRLKDQFLAVLSHELRNPLAAVDASLELLRVSEPANRRVQDTVARMSRQMKQLLRLVEDLLDLSRLQTGKIHLRPARLDLRDVVGQALDANRGIARRRLDVRYPPAPVCVMGDEVRLVQVFSNLLDNAVKYTRDQGCIWVDFQAEGEAVQVRVRDDGRGLPAAAQARIFDMYAQEDPARQSGLGIGLALVRQLLELHGGRIEVQSDGEGKGCEFTVTLPVGRVRGREAAQAGYGNEMDDESGLCLSTGVAARSDNMQRD